MAEHRGTEIIVASDPKGQFIEGTVLGTPRPGVVMQIDTSAGLGDDGRHTVEPFTVSDGARPIGPLMILLPAPGINTWDLNTTAFPATTTEYWYSAYVTGGRAFLYVPSAGEEFNMIIQDVSGTGDTHTIGEELMIDSGTGTLIAQSSEQISPFMLVGAAGTAPAGDFLAHVVYTGY